MNNLADIGAAGLRVHARALATVGDNIAQAGVAGYSRRTALLAPMPTGMTSPLVRADAPGGLVTVQAIQRSADDIRTAHARDGASSAERLATQSSWLQSIETTLATAGGLPATYGVFRDALGDLAAASTATAPRDAVLGAAHALADQLRGTATALAATDADMLAAGRAAAAVLNDAGTQLVSINRQLLRAPAGSDAAAQLADERDRLLGAMAASADIAVSLDAQGRATVRLAGDPAKTLVQNDKATPLAFDRAGLLIHDPYGTPSLATVRDGQLAGIAAARATLRDRIIALDSFAHDLTGQVNTALTGAIDLDGLPGAALFDLAPGASAATLAVHPLTARGLAVAATSSAGTLDSRDNSALLALNAALDSSGHAARLQNDIDRHASLTATSGQLADAAALVRTQAEADLESRRGVNLDEEAADLMRLQQAYEAAAKVIAAAQSLFATIVEIR